MNINDIDVNTSFDELVGCLGTADGTDIDDLLFDRSLFTHASTEWEEKHRWQTYSQEVYTHIPSGRFFAVIECAGNTENQEGEDTEFNGEVFPHEVTVTQYRSEPKR